MNDRMKNIICPNCGADKFWVYILNSGNVMIECGCGRTEVVGTYMIPAM